MVTLIGILLLTTSVCYVMSNPLRDANKFPPQNVPDFDRSLSYIERTVKEVQTILNSNASLPRLTRGEILEIIENITKTDLAAAQKQKNNERSQKAVMLVMPYTANNGDDGKIQELYTKPPITKMIHDSSQSTTVKTRSTTNSPLRSEVPFETTPKVLKNKTGEIQYPKRTSIFLPTTSPPVRTQQPLLLHSSELPRGQITTKTVQQYFDQIPYRKYRSSSPPPSLILSTTTSTLPNLHTNIIRRRRPTKPAHRHPNHKYPEESPISSSKITSSVSYTTLKPEKFTFPTVAKAKPSRPHSFTTAKPSLIDVPLPDELKSTLDELNFGDSLSKNPTKYDFFNLPNSGVKTESIYDVTSIKPAIPDISIVADTLTPDMKELLTNFGLLADTNPAPAITDENAFVGTSTAEVRPDSYVQFKPLPELGEPNEEMEAFLERFGLGKSAKSNRKSKLFIQDPNSVLEEAPDVEFEMLPDTLRDTVKDLGFTDRQGKKVRDEEASNSVNRADDKLSKPEKRQHVFNPMKTRYATQDEIDKLNQLMDIIKQLDLLNGTLQDESANQITDVINRDKFGLIDKQKNAPNPVHFDGGLTKNEIKRQENLNTSTTTSSTTTSSTTTEAASTTTLVEPETPNIKDLEDSFGGAANAEPEVTVTIPPPTEAPKTGFYYLLDWNSFLDIDDQKGKRVNLRFQPKAGNPQDFIAVSIP